MEMIGYFYNCGIGTYVNKEKAFEFYQKAANLNHMIAQYNLAVMYETGNGVAKDIKKAKDWYRKSAVQGYKQAIKRLQKL